MAGALAGVVASDYNKGDAEQGARREAGGGGAAFTLVGVHYITMIIYTNQTTHSMPACMYSTQEKSLTRDTPHQQILKHSIPIQTAK